MKLNYKCLIIDHDDTTVRSTPEIHYPQWLETIALFRPGYTITLEEFMINNSKLGFYTMLDEVMHFTPEECALQYKMWREYTVTHIASFFDGIGDILKEYRESGGIIVVSTHNAEANIHRDYDKEYGGVFYPDKIFDCELGEGKVKPSTFAVEETMRLYNLEKKDIVVVDDMNPGKIMAANAGVTFAGAGWAHIVPEIRDFMKQGADVYLEKTSDLRQLLLSE